MPAQKKSLAKPPVRPRSKSDLWLPALQQVVDALDEAVLAADAQGTLVLFNSAAEQVYGNALHSILGSRWHPRNVYLPDRKTPCTPDQLPLYRATQGESIDDFQVFVRNSDAEGHWISISARPLRNLAGQLEGGITICEDVTSVRESQRALDDMQQALASISDFSNDAIITEALDGTVLSWNRGAEQMFGYRADEIVGHSASMLAVHGEQTNPSEVLHKISSGQIIEHLSTLRRHKDGRALQVLLTLAPKLNESGKIVGAFAIARDMTETTELIERERTASAAAFAESHFRKLIEAAPDAILEVNDSGKIAMLNAAAEKIFGYSREELLGLNVDALVPNAMRGRHHQHRDSYTGHPQTRPMGTGLELHAQRKDGSLFPVEISLSPNRVDGELRVIAVVRDISPRKEIESRLKLIQEQYTAELAAKNQQLEARNRDVEKANRLKSEFLASMSHELRTPLHTIIGFSELLGEELEGPLSAKQKRFVGHILQDSRHLLELINEILDISKIESGRLELQSGTFEFNSCLNEVLGGIHPQAAAKQIRVENRNQFQGMLFADRLRVKEILYNLLSNAVKFTSEGGVVWVESSADDQFLRVTVGDTGIGIVPEEQELIFEKFYQVGSTTKGTREGTGLGLPITRKLVELHGGSMTLLSKPGEGSQFTFTLPLSVES